MWVWILKVLGQGEQNITLDKMVYIDMGEFLCNTGSLERVQTWSWYNILLGGSLKFGHINGL